MFDQLNESMKHIDDKLKSLLLGHHFILRQVTIQVPTITKLLNDVIIVARLHHVEQ